MQRSLAPAGVLLLAAVVLAACTGQEAAAPSTTPAPSATGSTTPAAPSPPPEPPVVTTLRIAGDIMLDRGVTARSTPAEVLRPMTRHLRGADLTVGNLESSLSERGAPTQQPVGDSFAARPAVLADLQRAGFDALSLANNHTGDYGERALLDTVRAFDGRRIAAFGAGRDLRRASRPAILEHEGVTFGLLGFNAIGETPPATPGSPGALSVGMPPRTGPLDRRALRHVLGLVRRLEARVDVVVVLPHWGNQYTHAPEPEQSVVGRRLVDAGADLVAGGHPHWVQATERYRGAVIAHSLGNFVFDMDFAEQTMQGVTLTATFEGDRLAGVDLTPYRIGADFAPRIVRGAEARAILADMGR